MAKMVVSLSVIPLGTPGTSASAYVREVVSVLRSMGLRYRVGAGFTDLELDSYGELADVLRRLEEALASMGVMRIDFFVKIDRRLDAELSIDGKISKVS